MVGMLVGYEYSVQSFRRDIQAGKLRFYNFGGSSGVYQYGGFLRGRKMAVAL